MPLPDCNQTDSMFTNFPIFFELGFRLFIFHYYYYYLFTISQGSSTLKTSVFCLQRGPPPHALRGSAADVQSPGQAIFKGEIFRVICGEAFRHISLSKFSQYCPSPLFRPLTPLYMGPKLTAIWTASPRSRTYLYLTAKSGDTPMIPPHPPMVMNSGWQCTKSPPPP